MAEVKPMNLVKLKEGQRVNNITVEKLKEEYSHVFEEEAMHGRNAFLLVAKVCHREINWKVKPKETLLTKTRINYDIGQVPQHKIDICLKNLVKQGIVEELNFEDKCRRN